MDVKTSFLNGCQDNKRFTSGYIYMLAGEAISWKFVKQTLIVPSTMVVEFVTYFEASNHGNNKVDDVVYILNSLVFPCMQ
ncbi:hypothetical protein CR513_40572, partial [Mucuna pruriens]